MHIWQNKKNLDKRLACIAKAVPLGAALCDVGSDHAYLPLALFLEGRISRAVITDIHEGPLENAKKNIEAGGFLAKTEFHLCDGLASVDLSKVDAITIAGMGACTIEAILRAAENITEKHTLILQPMTQNAHLRQYLLTRGYKILRSEAVQDGRKFYLVMTAKKTDCKTSYPVYFYTFGADLAKTGDWQAYIMWELSRQKRKLRGLKEAATIDAQAVADAEILLHSMTEFAKMYANT